MPSPSVREAVSFWTDVVAAGAGERVVRDCPGLKDLAAVRAVSFMMQAEADRHWAIRYDDLALEDPPVQTFVLDQDSKAAGGPGWVHDEVYSATTTGAVFRYLASYAGMLASSFSLPADPATLWIVDQKLGPARAFDRVSVYEATNLFLTVVPSRQGDRLEVYLAPGGRYEDVPDALWELVPFATSISGEFAEWAQSLASEP